MKNVRKVLALLLSFAMLFCLAAGGVEAAATGPYSTKKLSGVKRYTFQHKSASGEEQDYKSVLYYTDDYFTLDPTAASPNISFMTASYAMAFSSMNSNERTSYADGDRNLKDLLKKIGYRNYRSNAGFRKKPTANSIGVGAACRKVNGATVIAVSIRGGGYEVEMAGNFDMGRHGQHRNFALAAAQVLTFLKQYIKDNNIKGHVKLWMTGISRGAAVGNLAAAAIDDGALKDTGIQLGSKDLYAMLFEPPMGAERSAGLQNKKYDNIWNVINPYDAVPLFAMKEFGFGIYGRVWHYPTRHNASDYASRRNAMVKLLYAQSSHEAGNDYTADDFQMYKLDLADGVIAKDTAGDTTLEEFLPELTHLMATKIVGSRDNFVRECQNGAMTLVTLFYNRSVLTGDESAEGFRAALQKNLQEESMAQRLARAAAKPYDPTYGFDTVVRSLLVESLNDAGVVFPDPVALSEFLTVAVKAVAGLLLFAPDLAVTALMNITPLANCHDPEVNFAWLMSLDPNYQGVKDCL